MASADADAVDTTAGAGHRRAFGRILAVFIVTIAVDQATKEWALRALDEPGEVIEVLGPLQWNLVRNYGASFSVGEGGGPIISVIAVVVAAAMIWFGRRQIQLHRQVLYGLIAGGAIGNVIDRAFRRLPGEGFLEGGVVDFVDVQFWPVWNVADMAVVCSAIVLVGLGFLDDRRAARDAEAST